MIITFQGEQFFKLQAGETVIAMNPIAAKKGSKVSKFGADMALSTSHDDRFNGFDTVTYGDKEPLRLDGPGSYESGGMMIQGYGVGPNADGEMHTVYSFTFDNIKIAFLGSVGKKEELSPEALEDLADSDLVFADVAQADSHALAVALAPKAVIPMGYTSDKDPALKDFLESAGAEKNEALAKLTIKRKDLDGMTAHVYVFKA